MTIALGAPVRFPSGLAAVLSRRVAAGAATAWDRLAARARPAARGRDNTRTAAFTVGTVALAAKLAGVDGEVTRAEIAAFRLAFRVADGELAGIQRAFNVACRNAGTFRPYARQIARLFEPGGAVLEDVMHCLFAIAKADGVVGPAETAYLAEVASIFGFDRASFARLRADELGLDELGLDELGLGELGLEDDDVEADSYAVLGVAPGTPMPEVHTAYRRLVRESHPDRLIGEGAAQASVAIANARTAALNVAYADIRDRSAA